MHNHYQHSQFPHFELRPMDAPKPCNFPDLDLIMRELQFDLASVNPQDLNLVMSYQKAALATVENKTGLRLREQSWEIQFDYFPSARLPLGLPLSPIRSIESVRYLDLEGVEQQLGSADYVVTFGMRSRIQPTMGFGLWPWTIREIGSVIVQATSGIDSQMNSAGFNQQSLATMYADLGQAIILIIRDWWTTRPFSASGSAANMKSETIGDYSYTRETPESAKAGIPAAAQALIEPYCIITV